MRVLVFILATVMFYGCFVGKQSHSRRFSFYKEDRPHELSLQVPTGFIKESIKIGDIGKEQFYQYSDGAVFFVGLNMTWPTLNQEKKLVPYFTDTIIKSGYFKGIDSSGLHFKEAWFDHFVVGYASVKPSKYEQFERAVHSVRFKRPSK